MVYRKTQKNLKVWVNIGRYNILFTGHIFIYLRKKWEMLGFKKYFRGTLSRHKPYSLFKKQTFYINYNIKN